MVPEVGGCFLGESSVFVFFLWGKSVFHLNFLLCELFIEAFFSSDSSNDRCSLKNGLEKTLGFCSLDA